ncbi:MAG: sensor histidine kinase, partial [Actinomycetes bacterium]
LRWIDWRQRTAAAEARRDERLAIAGELHDVVGHNLTGIVVQAQAARHVAGEQPAAALDALARIEQEGAAALAAMRRMVGAMRDDVPTAPAAGWQEVRDVVARTVEHGIPVTLRIGPGTEDVAPDVVTSAHRIVTEALTNVARHATAPTAVNVDIEVRRDRLLVTVADDGRGASAPRDGYGLVGMRERVETLGGTLVAGPEPSGGWLVRAELPAGRSS